MLWRSLKSRNALGVSDDDSHLTLIGQRGELESLRIAAIDHQGFRRKETIGIYTGTAILDQQHVVIPGAR